MSSSCSVQLPDVTAASSETDPHGNTVLVSQSVLAPKAEQNVLEAMSFSANVAPDVMQPRLPVPHDTSVLVGQAVQAPTADQSVLEGVSFTADMPPGLMSQPLSQMYAQPAFPAGIAGGPMVTFIPTFPILMAPHQQPLPPMIPVPSLVSEAPPASSASAPVPIPAPDKKELVAKPYERRNKKRRPPDYYDKLDARQRALSQTEAAPPVNGVAELQSTAPDLVQTSSTGTGPLPSCVDPAALPHFLPPNCESAADVASPSKPAVADHDEQHKNVAVCSQIYKDASRTIDSDATGVSAQVPLQSQTEPVEPAPPQEPVDKPSVDKPPEPPTPKVNSWAELVRGKSGGSVMNDSVVNGQPNAAKPSVSTSNSQVISADQEKGIKQLGAILKNNSLDHRSNSIQPRGLYNNANWCYINATLQALIACPPFFNLFKSLPEYPELSKGPSTTPVVDSIVEFVNSFSVMPYKPLEKKALNSKGTMHQDIHTGPAFEPTQVYAMLHKVKNDTGFQHGRQEDAEEFLSCLLNALHDEMVSSQQSLEKTEDSVQPPIETVGVNGNGVADDAEPVTEDGWEKVGPKNKSILTRETKSENSPISAMMRGQMRSMLHKQGAKESATLQPFFTLQLDTQGDEIRTVEDALSGLTSKETLHGFTCSKTKQQVDATQRLMFEELPPVLILHLKWFSYDKSGGIQKNVKQVGFKEYLEISKDLLSPNVKSRVLPSHRKYKLFAVVNHHGVRAVGGHYTVDVFHPGICGWVHCDDSHVQTIPTPKVLKYNSPKVPYLLYYRRLESVDN